MRQRASANTVVRAVRFWVVVLVVGMAMMAGGSVTLPVTVSGSYAPVAVHSANDGTVLQTADTGGTPVEQVEAVTSLPPSVVDQQRSGTSWVSAALGGHATDHRVRGTANVGAVADPLCLEPKVTYQPPAAQSSTKVDWRAGGFPQQTRAYRARYNTSPGRNVAVFQYCDNDGQLMTITVASNDYRQHSATFDYRDKNGKLINNVTVRDRDQLPGGPFRVINNHSEMLLKKKLVADGIPLENVREGYTEREPCVTRGRMCKPMLARELPYARVTHSFDTDESHKLEDTVKGWYEELAAARLLFKTAHQGNATGALADTLSLLASPPSGGIDFSSLELRYLADSGPGDNQGLRYAFTALPATEDQDPTVGLQAAQQASDVFFVWLGLPTSKFWVNLNPNEPDRIVDAQLGRTDAGRVLLEADLQMKKTVAQLIHPDTPLGAQFWAALDMDGTSGSCLSFRQWIVPAPATIRKDPEALYILNAPLLVQLESEYIALRGDSNYPTSCAPQQESVEQHNEAVFRSMILPRVQQAVNEAPEYAELRRVYLSRIAAEWYRQQSAHADMTFTGLIDSGDITPWVSRQPWSPQDVFNRYVQSYTNGEFNVTRQAQQGNLIETNTYIFGGVDFTSIPFHSLSAGDFQSEWSDLSNTVEQAFDHPTPDEKGKVWLGSMSGTGSQHGSKIDLSGYLFFTVIGIAAAVSTRSWWRLRRARRDWARASPSAPSR
jgi:hypothetical protein